MEDVLSAGPIILFEIFLLLGFTYCATYLLNYVKGDEDLSVFVAMSLSLSFICLLLGILDSVVHTWRGDTKVALFFTAYIISLKLLSMGVLGYMGKHRGGKNGTGD